MNGEKYGMSTTDQILKDIPKGLIAWIKFNITDRVLYVGKEFDSVAEHLRILSKQKKIKSCQIYTVDEIRAGIQKQGIYDVIISVSDIEIVDEPIAFIGILKNMLSPQGRFFMGANNRLGIRFFCGDRDKYTGRNFDGIENYRRYAVKKEDILSGHMYDKAELKRMLRESGFIRLKMYSVFPNLEFPSMIFAEDYIPNEELNIRIFPMYEYPDTIFLEEEYLYKDLIDNNLFHSMANAFLIECVQDSKVQLSDIEHVTMSLDRGREDALLTIVHSNKIVEKKAVFEAGVERLYALMRNAEDLKEMGIKMVEANLEGLTYVMPYVEAESALSYLRRLGNTDIKQFVSEMDRFFDTIMQSSNKYKTDIKGRKFICFKRGYIDLVPLNCFVVNGEYVFYDQEFCVDDCPVSVLVVRLIDLVYGGNIRLEKTMPRKFF